MTIFWPLIPGFCRELGGARCFSRHNPVARLRVSTPSGRVPAAPASSGSAPDEDRQPPRYHPAVQFRFEAPLWMHTGEAAWHFVTLPPAVADEIEDATAGTRHGFGSVPVLVTIGATTWTTSIFPDTKARSYVLPVKKAVRRAEGLADGDLVKVTLDPQAAPPS